MHWTVSAGTLLHLLFCALIVAVNFVCALIAANDKPDTKTDYNHFGSKYFGENETYNNDKRLIIEDFYRQSALAAKTIQEMSFHVNRSGNVQKFEADDEANRNDSTPTTSHYNEGNLWIITLLKFYELVGSSFFTLKWAQADFSSSITSKFAEIW